MRITKTFGPPGTGKTTDLIARVAEEKAAGVPLPEIGYLSFSVAAKDVIRERLGATEQDVRWFRTIHGAACKQLGIAGSIMQWQHYRKFHEETGMKITPDDFQDEFDRKDMDFNIALRAHNLSQTMLLPPREVIRTLPDHPNLQWARYSQFVETFQKFKRQNHLFDFMDMLVDYDRDGEPLPIRVGMLDEGQDLSALQWRCFEKMVSRCERVYMAGDDDQSIYTFIGASEYGFLDHAADEERVLKKSYRVPQIIGEQADRIIKRVTHRKEKEVEWMDKPGEISRINQDAMGINWKCLLERYPSDEDSHGIMVLNRHRKGAVKFSDDLKMIGIPHSLNGETMNTWPEARILHSLYSLKDGKTITSGAALKLAEALGRDTHPYREMGRRERVEEIEGVNLLTLDWLSEFSKSRRERMRYQSLLRLVKQSGYEALIADPSISISTMHASKGKEAKLVIIIPDCTNVVKRNIETPTEIRLAYVSLTRAKQAAMLVIPRTDTFIQHFFQ